MSLWCNGCIRVAPALNHVVVRYKQANGSLSKPASVAYCDGCLEFHLANPDSRVSIVSFNDEEVPNVVGL